MKKNLPEIEDKNRQVTPPARVEQQRQETLPIQAPNISAVPLAVARYASARGGGKATTIANEMVSKGILTQNWVDAQRTIAQGNAERNAETARHKANLAKYDSWDESERQALQNWLNEGHGGAQNIYNILSNAILGTTPGYHEMNRSAQVESAYQALGDKYGEGVVAAVAESVQRMMNQELTENVGEYAHEAAEGGHIVHDALSVGANLAGGILNPLGILSNARLRTGQFQNEDPNQWGNILNTYSDAVREEGAKAAGRNIMNALEVAGRVGKAITGNPSGENLFAPLSLYDTMQERGETGGVDKLGSFAYQGAMNVADSLARLFLAMGTADTLGYTGAAAQTAAKWVTRGLAALSTWGPAYTNALEKGATPGEAAAAATSEAGWEFLTEAMPLDNWFKLAKGGTASVTDAIIGVAKQMGLGILEEETSLLGNYFTQWAILREKSDYKRSVEHYLGEGLDQKQAELATLRDLWGQMKDTAAVAAFGELFGSAGALINSARTGQTAQGEPNAGAAAMNAIDHYLQMGSVPKDMANQILQDRDVVRALSQETGIQISGRKQVEQAIQQIANQSVEYQNNQIQQRNAAAQNQAQANQQPTVPPATVDTTPAAPAQTPIDRAIANYRQNGAVTNSMAEAILADSAALEALSQQTGLTFEGTKSEQRKAVKGAIEQLSSQSQIQQETQQAQNPAAEEQAQPAAEAPLQSPTAAQQKAPEESPTQRLDRSIQAALRGETVQPKQTTAAETRPIRKPSEQSNSLPVGARVRANDRGNIGTIVGKDEYGFYRVQFRSREGLTRTITMSPRDITPIGRKPVIKGTGAAEANFAGKQQFENLLSDENVQPKRPTDVRDAETLKRDAQGRRVTEFAKNATGASITPDEMVDLIQKMEGSGVLSFDRRTNAAAMEAAGREISARGVAATRREIAHRVDTGKTKDGDIAQAMMLYAHYANSGDMDNASEMMVDLAAMANRAGRDLQLFRVLRMMTPEGQLLAVQKTIQRSVDRVNRRRNGRNQVAPVAIPESMASDYMKAAKAADGKPADSAEHKKLAEIENAIYKYAGSQIPASFIDQWNAWRYMAMLGNAKTQIRNIVGNAAFMPYKYAKDTISAALQKVFVKQENRTASFLNYASEEGRALLSWAHEDSKTDSVRNILKGSAKAGDDMSRSAIQEGRRIFDYNALEKAREIIEKVPEAADMFFKTPYYDTSLAGFIHARGYTAEQARTGQIPTQVLTEGREYAIQEAMKATFNDANALSDFFSNLRYQGDNPVGKIANAAFEGVMPFRRTPANIVVRFAEYSPVGIITTGVRAGIDLHNGNFSAATMIDGLSASLTGSAMAVLGYALASGMFGYRLRGGEVDEDEKRRGVQEYAIEMEVDGQMHSYTIDWAAPANLPLFLGANLYEVFHDADPEANMTKFTRFLYGCATAFEPMLELSCLSGINDLFESGKYTDGTALYSAATQIATGYFTQGIPALLRQTSQVFQTDKQTTFANSEDPLIRGIQKKAATIPFVGSLFQTDKVDEWGQTEATGNLFQRVVNAYFNPGKSAVIDTSPLEMEIEELNKSVPDSVSPPDTPKTITYTDADGNRHENHRLTEQEYRTLAETQGKTAHELLTSAIESDAYQNLSPEQRAKVFEYVYDYAREAGRQAAFEGYEANTSSWMNDIEEQGAAAIIRHVISGEFDDSLTDLVDGKDGAVASMDEAWNLYDSLSATEQQRLLEESGGRVEYFIRASASGVETETFADLYMAYRNIDGQDMSVSEKANAWRNELQKAYESGDITARQRETLKKYMVFRYSGVVETDKYDAMTSAGLNASEAYTVVNLVAGLGSNAKDIKKAEAIVGAPLSEGDTLIALYTYLSDAQEKNLGEMIDLGYTADDYVRAWRLYSDESGTGKKARVIQNLMKEFGIDWSAASAIYKIYYS